LSGYNFSPRPYDAMLLEGTIVPIHLDNPPPKLEGLKLKTYSKKRGLGTMSRRSASARHSPFAEDAPPLRTSPPTVAGRPNTQAVCLGSLAMGVERPREVPPGEI
jgi:hypothetical protein